MDAKPESGAYEPILYVHSWVQTVHPEKKCFTNGLPPDPHAIRRDSNSNLITLPHARRVQSPVIAPKRSNIPPNLCANKGSQSVLVCGHHQQMREPLKKPDNNDRVDYKHANRLACNNI